MIFHLKKKDFPFSRFGEFRFIPFQLDFHRLLTKIKWLSVVQVTQIYNWITTQLLIAKIINRKNTIFLILKLHKLVSYNAKQ